MKIIEFIRCHLGRWYEEFYNDALYQGPVLIAQLFLGIAVIGAIGGMCFGGYKLVLYLAATYGWKAFIVAPAHTIFWTSAILIVWRIGRYIGPKHHGY